MFRFHADATPFLVLYENIRFDESMISRAKIAFLRTSPLEARV
jgi:hypothetical protein